MRMFVIIGVFTVMIFPKVMVLTSEFVTKLSLPVMYGKCFLLNNRISNLSKGSKANKKEK